MAFCSHCGAQNREGARFCESCGQLIGQAAPAAPGGAPTSPVSHQPAQKLETALSGLGGTPKTMLLIGIGLYVAAAALTLMGGNIINVVLSAAIAAGAYFAAYVPLSKGNLSSAANGATIAGGVALLFGFLGLFAGDTFAAIWNFAAGAMFGLAGMQIKKLG